MPDNNDSTFVFRLQSDNEQHDLSNTIKHWGKSQIYGDQQINAIKSTNQHSMHQPTSIPSPFARIALVKTALSEVATHREQALRAYQNVLIDFAYPLPLYF